MKEIVSEIDEKLREASCFGDAHAVRVLMKVTCFLFAELLLMFMRWPCCQGSKCANLPCGSAYSHYANSNKLIMQQIITHNAYPSLCVSKHN